MLSRSSRVGSASTALAGKNAGARLGPMPRTTISVHRLHVVAQEEARDHDVVTGADKGARAQVGQFRVHFLVEVVDFHQGDTGGVAIASHDRGIRSRIQRRNDR